MGSFSPDELERLGLYDPQAPDAADRLRMVALLAERGADLDEIVEAWETHGWSGWTTLAVELAIRPEGRLLSLAEAVERTGLDEDTLVRNWRMLGFPDPRAVTRPFTEAEAEVLALRPVTAAVVGEAVNDELARVVGMAMSRIAEACLSAFRVGFEMPRRQAGAGDVEVAQANADAAALVIPVATQMLDVAFRRHLLVGGYRDWSTDDTAATATALVAVGFVDLEGFTARAGALTPAELAAAVTRFEEVVSECAARHRGRVVKLIGDEAMFVTEGADDGALLAAELVRTFAGHPALPSVRVGIEWGSVATMYGDYYGDPVNLAARLVGQAEPGHALAGPGLAGALGEVPSLSVTALGPVELKGFSEPVPAFRLVP